MGSVVPGHMPTKSRSPTHQGCRDTPSRHPHPCTRTLEHGSQWKRVHSLPLPRPLTPSWKGGRLSDNLADWGRRSRHLRGTGGLFLLLNFSVLEEGLALWDGGQALIGAPGILIEEGRRARLEHREDTS